MSPIGHASGYFPQGVKWDTEQYNSPLESCPVHPYRLLHAFVTRWLVDIPRVPLDFRPHWTPLRFFALRRMVEHGAGIISLSPNIKRLRGIVCAFVPLNGIPPARPDLHPLVMTPPVIFRKSFGCPIELPRTPEAPAACG